MVFITPRIGDTEAASDWVAAACAADTTVIYMGARQAEAIAATLLKAGRAPHTPVAIVESASLDTTHTVRGTLEALPVLARSLGDGPALILIGAALRKLAAPAQDSSDSVDSTHSLHGLLLRGTHLA